MTTACTDSTTVLSTTRNCTHIAKKYRNKIEVVICYASSRADFILSGQRRVRQQKQLGSDMRPSKEKSSYSQRKKQRTNKQTNKGPGRENKERNKQTKVKPKISRPNKQTNKQRSGPAYEVRTNKQTNKGPVGRLEPNKQTNKALFFVCLLEYCNPFCLLE